ncbi:MAG: hypothetical protein HWD61_08970 [Parachlamydiaceae bacterium]|nr:MAG: hypothetical protein HWD61_08970 [Parachlamydiaceae bacterium]
MEFNKNALPERESDLIELNGKPVYHGPTIVFTEEGAIKQIAFYKEGKLFGPVKSYYPTGLIESVFTWSIMSNKDLLKFVMPMEKF